ncbi:hypothetical protein D9V37_09370 [Nocardioides mangrovicus]|uniref:Uncharacterized protein n=1 Tax=Nocardioides mangrovicus TaxID=2478913 RepID=A0A3L8P4J0_9ACTN|nr:hypothetical protein [Nocardioides mangrovicus]RLV50061.1 hypothetical protein D9V37_09370 [Nocardioides mangrovicus]
MGLQRQAPGTFPQGRALLLSTATTVTVVAWGVLVFAAIDFGRTARDGHPGDWGLLALATVGAVACMFLAIVLAARMQDMIRLSARSSTRPLPRSLQEPEETEETEETGDPGALVPPPVDVRTAPGPALEAAPDPTSHPTPAPAPDSASTSGRSERRGRTSGKRAVRR